LAVVCTTMERLPTAIYNDDEMKQEGEDHQP
jgi:hypothetical protein